MGYHVERQEDVLVNISRWLVVFLKCQDEIISSKLPFSSCIPSNGCFSFACIWKTTQWMQYSGFGFVTQTCGSVTEATWQKQFAICSVNMMQLVPF